MAAIAGLMDHDVFKTPFDLDAYLSYERDETGRIISGDATTMTWLGQVDLDAMKDPDSISGVATPVNLSSYMYTKMTFKMYMYLQVDDNTLEFEDELYEILEDSQDRFGSEGYEAYICIASGYDELAAESIISDALMMPVGFTIVFCYIMVVLGNYHCVETRVCFSHLSVFIHLT